jgi:retron-type reverse transcriptase
MATRTTTTSQLSFGFESSADQCPQPLPVPGPADFLIRALLRAHLDCRVNKRGSRACVQFEQDLAGNLVALREALEAGTYRPAPSICFIISRPKFREVWAAAYADRVVHHLLYNQIAERFHRSFIADSCACIPGRGTLYAAKRLDHHIRSATRNWTRGRGVYYLKCDVQNFFVSIDKNIVRTLLARRVHEPWWMNLAEVILFHDPRPDAIMKSTPAMMAKVPAHKSLLNQPTHLGLPIGNLSSQFFANVLLDPLDQFIKHQLRIKGCVRYVDDLLLLSESADELNEALGRIQVFLKERLALQLNPSKTILQPVERGVDFVGQVILPWRRKLRKRTRNDALARMAVAENDDLMQLANSYFGLFGQATASHHDRARLANIVRARGHAVNRELTKTYRGDSR